MDERQSGTVQCANKGEYCTDMGGNIAHNIRSECHMNIEQQGGGNGAGMSPTMLAAVAVEGNGHGKLHGSSALAKCCLRD